MSLINWSEDKLEGISESLLEPFRLFIHKQVAIPQNLRNKAMVYAKARYRKVIEDEHAVSEAATTFLGYSVARITPPTESRKGIERNSKGIARWSRDNVRYALEVELKITLRRNEFSNRTEVLGAESRNYTKFDKAFHDWISLELTEKLNFSQIGKGDCSKILKSLSIENSYHPVKDYINNLSWDGVPRLDTWLIRHAGAEDTEYVRAVSSLTLKAAVKRIMYPGTKFDEILVLISPQGWSKGEALRALSVDISWLLEEFDINWSTKQIMENTSGRWLVEYAELDNLSEKQFNRAKTVLGMGRDISRMAYAEETSEFYRHFIIIATSNKRHLFADFTGNRRYWPVELKHKFNVKDLSKEVDQLWAEAKHRALVLNESIHLEEHLWEVAAVEQEKHEVESPVLELLTDVIGDKTGLIKKSDLRLILGINPTDNRLSGRIKQSMERLGWKSSHNMYKGTQVHCWYKEGRYLGWWYPIQKENSPLWSLSEDHSVKVPPF